jgi:hypothetical protein
MKERCLDPNLKSFKDYGGRGITVCDRWLNSFPNFLADMGPRPTPKHSIDRIGNNGNYEPGNCRWATWDVQSRNMRGRTITFSGETYTGKVGPKNAAGKQFARLTAIEFVRNQAKAHLWLWQCECGNQHLATLQNVRRGAIKSCGCWQRERLLRKAE